MEAQSDHYSGLEAHIQLNHRSASVSVKLKRWLTSFSNYCVHLLIDQGEPRISQRIDRTGKTCWYIYNPTTQKTYCFDSETEVRIWIEQRYS